LTIIQKITNWRECRDPNYKVAIDELEKAGVKNILYFLFLGVFTSAFVFFKYYFYDVYDSRDTLNILLDGTLWVFTVLVVLSMCAAHHLFRDIRGLSSITKFCVKYSFDFFMGLIFIFIAGISVKAFTIPFLKLDNPIVFVAFTETILFLCLTFWMKTILHPSTPNKSKLLKRLLITSTLFGLISIGYSF
jgi:hypothetical protein